MTEGHINSLDVCYDCKKKDGCLSMGLAYDLVKNTSLASVILQECDGYE